MREIKRKNTPQDLHDDPRHEEALQVDDDADREAEVGQHAEPQDAEQAPDRRVNERSLQQTIEKVKVGKKD